MLRIALLTLIILLTSCGYHLQGKLPLAPPLHRVYVQSRDPYGHLVRNLQQYLKLSDAQVVSKPQDAQTIIAITNETTSQELMSVSGTNQVRQYTLKVIVTFEITDTQGRTILPAESLTESRVITIQENEVLGSSNETNLFYQQMRRALAYAIMNRISSHDVTKKINDAFGSTPNTAKAPS